jgi:HlyD family secretion protein
VLVHPGSRAPCDPPPCKAKAIFARNVASARIIFDPAPQYVVPASVSFVATDAQFTPKNVEITDEREKLMFRVKLKVDARVLKEYSRRVKTGVRGLGIVRTNTATAWPEDAQVKLP